MLIINLPRLDILVLLGNKLTEIKLGNMPEIFCLNLLGNHIKKLNLLKSNMPALRQLILKDNPLRELTLPYNISCNTGLITKEKIDIWFQGIIPSVTAFYCPADSNVFNKKWTAGSYSVKDLETGDVSYPYDIKKHKFLGIKRHEFRGMNFTNWVEAARNWDKIFRWMVSCNKS